MLRNPEESMTPEDPDIGGDPWYLYLCKLVLAGELGALTAVTFLTAQFGHGL